MIIEFVNGFTAELKNEGSATSKIVRLYTPDGEFLSSCRCEKDEEARMVAQALMQGFFDGFRFCKYKLRESMKAAFVSTGIVNVKRS